MGIDLVIVSDEQTSSNDFVRVAQLAARAGQLLASVDCVPLDERSAALWAALRESPFLAGLVRTSPTGVASGSTDSLSTAVEAGTARFVAVSEIHEVDLTRLLVAATTAQEHQGVSLGTFPLGAAGGLSLVLPRTKWSPCGAAGAVRSARTLMEALGGHLLGLEGTRATPEVTKIWVVGTEAGGTVDTEIHPGSPPVLSVVVPTLDAASARSGRLLASLRRHTGVPYQVVLIDNGNAPQGYTAPVNTALLAARTEYVAVINDDVVVHDRWWEPLQEALTAGHALVFPETIGYSRPPYFAWCFALRRSTLEGLSAPGGDLFDPAFSVWYQDTDLYLRLKALGETPYHVPASRISHLESATVATEDPVLKPWIRRQTLTDRSRFVEKWGEGILPDKGLADPLGSR